MIKYSVLDLVPIAEGSDARTALRNSRELAQKADSLGYSRYWLAEHHNMPGIASSATSILINYIASCTKDIRVGSGGIMLPNHAPLVIAEQFGTLEALHPNRIDLGIGRAPGADMLTAQALRRDLAAPGDQFLEDLEELEAYLENGFGRIQAVPGGGARVPIWLLGSSLFSAKLAAVKGLPYAFASHFAPEHTLEALSVYRANFKPSPRLEAPYVAVGVNLYAADTTEEAHYLFTSLLQTFIALRFGKPGKLPAPVRDLASQVYPSYLETARRSLAYSAVGDRLVVEQALEQIIRDTMANELILTGMFYDQKARIRSNKIGADAMQAINKKVSL